MSFNSYVVGSNQLRQTGDQKKHFVSKSTLIYCTSNITLKFNSMNNADVIINANTYYEFKSNIHTVFYAVDENECLLQMWFEGVMYNETRRPE